MKKNVIVTGSNRGIGKAMLYEFARNGYNVWACARKQTDEFESYIEELKKDTSSSILPIYFDLSDKDEVKTQMKQILSSTDTIDVLINNAGIPHSGLLTMTSISNMKEVYEINVFAQVFIMQLVARKMMRQKNGCIINMCSVGGIETTPGYLAYGSSKAALIWITKCASKELGRYNIRVNGIAPGLIDTDMGNYKSEEELKKVLARTSLQRMGNTEDIAKAALYIASDAASYMTGHIMVLDGGRI